MLTNPSSQIDLVTRILAESFGDDPSFSFVFGGKPPETTVLKTFFELFVSDAIERGKVIIDPDEQGSCIWYPAEVEIFNQQFEEILSKIIYSLSELAGSETGKRFEHLIEKVSQNEPTQKHCEVFFLGLKPEARGKGIGKILLKPVLDYADTNQINCYLVSSNTRNVSFYERNGFEKYSSIKITDSYSMTGMWRNPR